MKVLVVTNMYAGANTASPNQGVFVTEQVDALRRLPDTEVDVMTVNGFSNRLAYPASLFALAYRVLTKKYDIVHYHFGLTAWTAPFLRVLTRAKVVITLHGSDVMGSRFLQRVTRFSIRYCDLCIAVSDAIRNAISSRTRHCVTVPCAVNDVLFMPPVGGRKKDARRRIVVFPSSPARPEKDHPLFVAAIEHLRRISDYVIEERLIDGLDRGSVRELLQQADVLVLTSKREGSPQTVKEAMACALPVVSLSVGDIEQLLGGVNGCRVVRCRDPQGVAAAVAEVLDEAWSAGPARLRELGYLSADVAQRIRTLYQSELAGSRSAVTETRKP
ncbi:glycosyltransferase family 4 protein [Paraburkholderia lacunae]|uniref:Glycosyltransferase subfamily 4-like N-terminal domain-containing protein n=1 Tax=Paraburkholderia lacunae TaxID=2211104 RepID=A0A370N1J6_9BURK|nr:glycosyltransferase family 4 protein [Paraburkholderia lacunae]RDJ99491.1 hypothetical protein DLM46_27830 [Paraburkholderia lacunae]